MSIPASAIVGVIPSVISGGGSALDVIGLVLTSSTRVPIGTNPTFPDLASVISYFGAGSAEAAFAAVYFLGYDDSTVKPGGLVMVQFPSANVAGYMRGGNVAAALTLTQLKAQTGVLTVVSDGVSKTSTTINLTSATSFSNAATLILAAFTTPGFTVTFDSVSGAFVFTSSTAGASSSTSFATGSLAAPLLLTAATGAVVSPGALNQTPAQTMAAIVSRTQNFVTFTTLTDPDAGAGNTLKLAFAAWSNSMNKRYLYVPVDTDLTPTQSTGATSSLGYILKAGSYEGTAAYYDPTGLLLHAFEMGGRASVDYTETNGRSTSAFRRQTGLTPSVVDATVAANLIANGYNFYGDYATANQRFQFEYPGQMTGSPYLWIDSYTNQIQLNAALQLALMTLLVGAKSIPYNQTGYSMIRAACADPINAALNFGSMRAGVPLSALQASQVNTQAGLKIDTALSNLGFYLQVLPATAQVRAARGTPPCKLWYMDGQSVQSINLASVAIQ